MDIMVKPISEEDDERWANLIREELVIGSRKRGPYSDANVLADIASLSYADIKSIALENILTLEQRGKLTRDNQYQDLLNEIAIDIRTKHRRRVQRAKELENVRATLKQLDDKASYLADKLKTYNDTFEQNLTVLQNKSKGKKRFLMPFSKQYNHERELARNGLTPTYGSYKYAADVLAEKGILIEWRGRRNLREDDITISSNEVNVFLIEGSTGNFMIPGASETFTWDDLIEAQYQSQKNITFFASAGGDKNGRIDGPHGPSTGELIVDAKLFMQQVSKKFWRE